MRRLVLDGLRDRWGSVDLALNEDLDDIAATYSGGIVLVAVLNRRIVGTGTVRPLGGTTGEVVRMAVAREVRRQGVGTALLSTLTAEAVAAGYRRLELATTADWHDAVRFYQRFGFELSHVTRGRFGLDAYFALDLDAPS